MVVKNKKRLANSFELSRRFFFREHVFFHSPFLCSVGAVPGPEVTWCREFPSGSPYSFRLHPAGSVHGRLSQGSYIPFFYGHGLEKWIRLP